MRWTYYKVGKDLEFFVILFFLVGLFKWNISPLAGESSITFDLSGPLLVVEINDLKGQAA